MCRISGGVPCPPALPLLLLLLLMDRCDLLGDEEEFVVVRNNSDSWNAGRDDDKTGSTGATKADPRQAKAETMASLCAMLLPALIIRIIMLLQQKGMMVLSFLLVPTRTAVVLLRRPAFAFQGHLDILIEFPGYLSRNISRESRNISRATLAKRVPRGAA